MRRPRSPYFVACFSAAAFTGALLAGVGLTATGVGAKTQPATVSKAPAQQATSTTTAAPAASTTTTAPTRDPFAPTTTAAPAAVTPNAGATTTINIGSAFVFSPANVTIHVGDTVEWVHDSSTVMHSVTADNGSFDSSPSCPPTCLGANATFSHTFTSAGTVRYYCKIHGGPGGVGMSGTITVLAATTTTTSPGATTTVPQSTAGTPGSPGSPGSPAAPAATSSTSLPRTGSNTVPLLLAGAAALFLGMGVLMIGRRRLRPTR